MRSSGVHTPSSWPAHSSFASARASRRSVFARAWRIPVSLGETTITRATCGSRIAAIAHALPVTSNATWSRGSRLCANSSSACGVVAIRPAERNRPSATIATSQKSRCTSRATALTSPPHYRWASRRTGGQTTSTDPRSQRNRASRRGGHRKARAQLAHRPKRPAQPAFSHEGPSSQSVEPKPAAGHHRSPQRAVSCPDEQQRRSRLPLLDGRGSLPRPARCAARSPSGRIAAASSSRGDTSENALSRTRARALSRTAPRNSLGARSDSQDAFLVLTEIHRPGGSRWPRATAPRARTRA
jgi:hypothetical protein